MLTKAPVEIDDYIIHFFTPILRDIYVATVQWMHGDADFYTTEEYYIEPNDLIRWLKASFEVKSGNLILNDDVNYFFDDGDSWPIDKSCEGCGYAAKMSSIIYEYYDDQGVRWKIRISPKYYKP